MWWPFKSEKENESEAVKKQRKSWQKLERDLNKLDKDIAKAEKLANEIKNKQKKENPQ